MTEKLYRSQQDKVLGGVCGGLGQYLAIDPVLIRLFFVVLALADGIGLLLYLVLWVTLPKAEMVDAPFDERVRTGAEEISTKARSMGTEIQQSASKRDPRVFNWIGGTLVALGAYFLVKNLHIPWLAWLELDLLWPLLLVGAGIVLILRRGMVDHE